MSDLFMAASHSLRLLELNDSVLGPRCLMIVGKR